MGQMEQRTVLIDGSLQFGDLRALLKVPADAPSILDLPTDRIAESDLGDVLWRDPSGIDILLAPPRIEMAEMVTSRDIEKVLSLLRRVYSVIVIDMSSYVNDVNLAFLDASDTIVEIVTYDSTTIHNTVAIADTFRAIGYAASKVRYLINRAGLGRRDRTGGPRAGARPRPGASGRVRRSARDPVQQRRRAVRAGQSGRRRSARISRGWPASCSASARTPAAAGLR